MTKVQLRYRLTGPLTDEMLDRIARAHGIYGIDHVRLEPGGDRITVEFDASRLNAREVEKTLADIGLGVSVEA